MQKFGGRDANIARDDVSLFQVKFKENGDSAWSSFSCAIDFFICVFLLKFVNHVAFGSKFCFFSLCWAACGLCLLTVTFYSHGPLSFHETR